jgi:hypothetical protein
MNKKPNDMASKDTSSAKAKSDDIQDINVGIEHIYTTKNVLYKFKDGSTTRVTYDGSDANYRTVNIF